MSNMVYSFSLGGLGTCPCCKDWKNLTEHHDKSLKVKIMICRDCHDVIEEYLKVQEKCKNIFKKRKS